MSPVTIWLRRVFTDSHFFFALKVLLAMTSLLLPGWWLDQTPAAVTLTLGAMAGALSEVDQDPKGRLRHLLLSLLCFFGAITLVSLLIDSPLLFGPLLVLSTLVLILMGAWGPAAGTLGFGTLLVSLYAMQGHADSPSFWYQPLLLTLGAAWYGLLSWLVLIVWPYKQVHEQLAQCYFALSRYLLEKSRFFDSPEEQHQHLRHQLAQLNIQLVSALETTKLMLNRRIQGRGKQEQELGRLLALYLLVQEMHERATSSHYSYQQLNRDLKQVDLLAGYQTLLVELGEACYRLGYAILTHNGYQHRKRIAWELSALQDQLDYSHLKRHYPRSLLSPMKFLGRNMAHLQQALLRAETLTRRQPLPEDVSVELARPEPVPFWPKLKALLHPNSLLFRHGVRLSLCFALGYSLIATLELERGYWILLTILFVCQPSFSATRKRLVQRTLGTLGGILAGIPLLMLFPSVGAQLVILLLCAFIFFTQVKVYYSWAVGFVTLFVLLAFNLQGGITEPVFLPRLLDTLAGCALAFVAVWFIWPDWQRRHLPRLMADAMEANAHYLAAIARQFAQGRHDELDYRLPRKLAHLADNQLALAWQNIRVEPVPKYWLNLCFDIAYRNHALLSYLSTLGAHRRHSAPLQDEQIRQLVSRLLASAQALRSEDTLPVYPPLSTDTAEAGKTESDTDASTDDEWLILSHQLLGHITLLVNDLYQLARGFRQQTPAEDAPSPRLG
ncbi:YccS family putative transporter [Oceanisphaera arctica]|uniref:TIGR01666 family membrane protein n=1 Tax=Oceanisphaera arctica TaxID=641510 RepID=A0A2P5TR04_9GAMM|nr:YccS family putative transporter [Oceanisphaera arctica]PPL18228.1 TIGR01666 family membrane protein [Oceanisphaera arctica]GHA12620.1 TIGR01666 family membrane protein [Oceanisphaera arctica]